MSSFSECWHPMHPYITTAASVSIRTNGTRGFVLWLDSQMFNKLLPLTGDFPLTQAFIIALSCGFSCV